MKWESRPKQKQDTTRYAIKKNKHNSHVARVPASSLVKRAVRYIFGAPFLTNFITVYLYVKKRPFTKAQTQFTCCHTYIKLVLFRSGCSFFRCFFILLLLEDEDPQNVRSGRRGKEKWLLLRFIDTRIMSKWLWLWLSVGSCRKSESLVKFIDQYYDLFFLYVLGRDSHFEMFSGQDFEESYPNIWSLLFCRQIRSLLATSREVILSRKSNLTCL